MSINLKKESVVCEALFYLKKLKLTCLEIFLSLFIGSSVKTTILF